MTMTRQSRAGDSFASGTRNADQRSGLLPSPSTRCSWLLDPVWGSRTVPRSVSRPGCAGWDDGGQTGSEAGRARSPARPGRALSGPAARADAAVRGESRQGGCARRMAGKPPDAEGQRAAGCRDEVGFRSELRGPGPVSQKSSARWRRSWIGRPGSGRRSPRIGRRCSRASSG